MDKLNGVVKFFNAEKGFGFIKDANSSNEYYVNKTGLLSEIEEGSKVEFELKEEKKGPMAVQVKKLEQA
jgi:cold shock protein